MVHMKQTREEMIRNLSPDQRLVYAEYLRERIYSTLTLLAVMTGLWRHADSYTPRGALGIVLGTVGAIWLATIVADRMSRTIVHGTKAEKTVSEIKNPATGLLEPAGVPALFIIFAALGWIQLSTALLVGVVVLVVSLFIFSVLSGRKIADSRTSLILYSLVQMLIGLGVVLLKIWLE